MKLPLQHSGQIQSLVALSLFVIGSPDLSGRDNLILHYKIALTLFEKKGLAPALPADFLSNEVSFGAATSEAMCARPAMPNSRQPGFTS